MITWTVEGFEAAPRKLYSDTFQLGGHNWRMLIYPNGYGYKRDHLSLYCEVVDVELLPLDWYICTNLTISVVNQRNERRFTKETWHRFDGKHPRWGFTEFMELNTLNQDGFMLDDRCVIEAILVPDVVIDPDNQPNVPEKQEDYVGLINESRTSSLNSLLQTLFHIPSFRKAVYHMPTTERSVALALQCLFYKLQYHYKSVSTLDLTKSFGLDLIDTCISQNNKTFNMLYEKLEETASCSGTLVDGMFKGHYIHYPSSEKESFIDLLLDVKGCKDVYASFDKMLEKSLLFIDFPPILRLQLKRWEHDGDRVTMMNDRYEFPLQLDIGRDDCKYLSSDADRNSPHIYSLHSVVVHSGGVNDGCYYAYIRPELSEQWFKFSDDQVSKVDTTWTLEEFYGGDCTLTNSKIVSSSNAYVLVYIRESEKNKIICNVDEKEDIAEQLHMRLKKEQEENAETIEIKIACDGDLLEQIGKDRFFDLVDHDKVRSFRVPKQTPFGLFKEKVAEEFDISVQHQRFWSWRLRANHTYRPIRPLSAEEEALHVVALRNNLNGHTQDVQLKLFVEKQSGQDMKGQILLFFKLYEPSIEKLRYVGKICVMSNKKPEDILIELKELAGFSPDEDIKLFEEINFFPKIVCVPINEKSTFRESQLQDGDIICFQKSLKVGDGQQYRYPDIPSFFEDVPNRRVVHFRVMSYWRITNPLKSF